jgi:hypothetical protein
VRLLPPTALPPEGISFQGTIVDRAYFGDHWDYSVKLANNSVIIASTEPYLEYAVGSDVRLAVHPDHISIIAGETAGSIAPLHDKP